MRIIENPNPVKEKELKCGDCECTFAYTPGDVRTESWNNGIIGPGYSGYYREYVICPNCGKAILVKNEETSEESSALVFPYSELEDIFPHLYGNDDDE